MAAKGTEQKYPRAGVGKTGNSPQIFMLKHGHMPKAKGRKRK